MAGAGVLPGGTMSSTYVQHQAVHHMQFHVYSASSPEVFPDDGEQCLHEVGRIRHVKGGAHHVHGTGGHVG